jgi:hypothetical protein
MRATSIPEASELPQGLGSPPSNRDLLNRHVEYIRALASKLTKKNCPVIGSFDFPPFIPTP